MRASWFGVLGSWAGWRITRAVCCGRRLIQSLESPDETTRNLAGTLLIRAGHLAHSLYLDALAKPSPMLLRIIADSKVDLTEFAPHFHRLANGSDETLSQAAREALEIARARGAVIHDPDRDPIG